MPSQRSGAYYNYVYDRYNKKWLTEILTKNKKQNLS